MPISTDQTRISVDFAYEWDNHTSGEKYTYQMRFIHSEAGPVIQIFDGAQEPIELPASMFTEVSEFLIRQGVMKGMPSITQPNKPTGGTLPVPSIGRKTRPGTVPVLPPRLARTGMAALEPGAPPLVIQTPDGPSESTPLIFRPESQEDVGAQQIAAATHEAGTPPPISPEESKRLLEARLAAKAKANTAGSKTAGSKIKSNPKFEGAQAG